MGLGTGGCVRLRSRVVSRFSPIGPMIIRNFRLLFLLVTLTCASAAAADNPKLTLDEFFNYVDFNTIALSPDGQSVVIETDRADWEQNIFRLTICGFTGMTVTARAV